MSFNKTLIVFTLALSVSLNAFATDVEEGSVDLKQLMKSVVPADELDREAELTKLMHLSRRFSALVDIAESKAKLQEAEAPNKKTEHQQTPFEQQIQAAMMANGMKGLTNPSTDSAPAKPKKKEGFSLSIDLLSLWGDPKNPTADVSINGATASTELRKGSFIDGWRVTGISSEYMDVKQGNNTGRVYFMNSTGQNL